MNKLFANLYDAQCKSNTSILKTSQPLKELLGINYFSYQKVYADGQYIVLCNQVDFLEYYIEKQFYLNDPFIIQPSHYAEGKVIHLINEKTSKVDEGLSEIQKNASSKYHFGDTLLFIEKNYDHYEIFVFAAEHTNTDTSLLLSKSALLERFITHFKLSNKNLLEKFEDASVNIANIRGENFLRLNPNLNLMSDFQTNSFLKIVSPEESTLKANLKTLTPREAECFYWVLAGKTAAEIGQILNISGRTVEIHKEKARQKCGPHYTITNLCYLFGKYQLLRNP